MMGAALDWARRVTVNAIPAATRRGRESRRSWCRGCDAGRSRTSSSRPSGGRRHRTQDLRAARVRRRCSPRLPLRHERHDHVEHAFDEQDESTSAARAANALSGCTRAQTPATANSTPRILCTIFQPVVERPIMRDSLTTAEGATTPDRNEAASSSTSRSSNVVSSSHPPWLRADPKPDFRGAAPIPTARLRER
jgi:hypothetical protein